MENKKLKIKIGSCSGNIKFCSFSIWIDYDFLSDNFEKQFGDSICFRATNGVVIFIKKLDNYISVKFNEIEPVDGEYLVDLENFSKIMKAINEYNETDGKGYEKKFPEEGDTFYCITSAMTVSLGEFGSSMDGYEFKMRDAGNCFQTFEEAKAALERVKKALKGE